MFGIPKKRGKTAAPAYDRERKRPAIRVSICTGEKVAGFLDKETGKFQEIQLIRTPRDLQAFCGRYGVEETEIREIY